MHVTFIVNKEPVLEAARHVSARSVDECFSAREVAHRQGLAIEAVLHTLGRLCDALWCTPVEMEPDSLNPDERWTLIRKSLTPGRTYEVLGIEAGSYRILNDPETWPYGNDFEDYHDGVEEVRQRFWEDVQRYYPETWQERKGHA